MFTRPSTSINARRRPRSQYRLMEDVEDLHRYRPGGYLPLQVGDSLADGRYQLVGKLGHGGYSTIWLARDCREARYVAVKVLTADASSHSSSSEVRVLRSLASASSRPLWDEFWVVGCNGRHRCVVTPPARMSLFDAKEEEASGTSMIAQLIRGVAFLHSLGFYLHLGNILVQFPRSIDSISPSELYERYGDPESEDVVRLDGPPLAEGVPTRDRPLGEAAITLSDFGESFAPCETVRVASKTLPLLQPPEARFSDEPLSCAVDVWGLACCVWEILGQRPLFETSRCSGSLPGEWWGRWGRRREWTGRAGPGGGRRSWERRFEESIQKPRAEGGDERAALMEMLRAMLAFRPEERITARQALQSRWMSGWGMPALQESGGISGTRMERT
ncbi:kinase-like protein [Aspergillus brunneoviolaceus CBS 621.78]|uniref:Kinase-like protein n=1 Tax=Aspergillus brunneoviolaceus CBS 621.78 TaxID=1450534 RepID=A0ACD1GNY9_9EURO|nr:kinase-like protein [Aspergillus brunneoviolaceus CBS 621.78]RAH51089.1 kinase-like protein [Aspergillus brunneoviolaceus CBS 621.78]